MSDNERNLCYDVSDYQRCLWRYRKLVDGNAEAAERAGKKQYEAFPDFSGEIFHKLYADEAKPLEEPVPGSEPFQKMHEEMDKLPELSDLRDRCKGDEEWSGIGTGAIIDTLLNKVDKKDDEQVEDLRDDLDAMSVMQRLLENTTDESQRDAIRHTINEIHSQIDNKQGEAELTANLMDESQVRSAVREACQKAMKEIEEREHAYDSFMAGVGAHGGRQAKRNASKLIGQALTSNERVRRIAMLAGRLRRIAIEQQRQKPRRGTDEITGVELGHDISKMVPSEALYTEPELELVFARKLMERSLQQFELNKAPPKQQGPIVVLLDSSASMIHNNADAWAAAVTLSFLEIANRQKRAFAIVHFGSDVLRVDDWSAKKAVPLEELLEAVSFFEADGGTNFETTINKGVTMIEKHGSFKNADIIMVTDGQASITDDWLKRFKMKKELLDFSLYSIVIGLEDVAWLSNVLFSDEVISLGDVLDDDKEMHRVFGRV